MIVITLVIFGTVAATLLEATNVTCNATCTTDTDCSQGKFCVPHYNYSSGSYCHTRSYCISATRKTCSCHEGYKCRLKDCPKSPYECVILENHETRCGGEKAPVCKEGEVCAYVYQNIHCYECPCYYTHMVSCVKISKLRRACGPNSIAEIRAQSKYSCDGCKSATAVLTPPTISPGP